MNVGLLNNVENGMRTFEKADKFESSLNLKGSWVCGEKRYPPIFSSCSELTFGNISNKTNIMEAGFEAINMLIEQMLKFFMSKTIP